MQNRTARLYIAFGQQWIQILYLCMKCKGEQLSTFFYILLTVPIDLDQEKKQCDFSGSSVISPPSDRSIQAHLRHKLQLLETRSISPCWSEYKDNHFQRAAGGLSYLKLVPTALVSRRLKHYTILVNDVSIQGICERPKCSLSNDMNCQTLQTRGSAHQQHGHRDDNDQWFVAPHRACAQEHGC